MPYTIPSHVSIHYTIPCLHTLYHPLSTYTIPSPVSIHYTIRCLHTLYHLLSPYTIPSPVSIHYTVPCLHTLYHLLSPYTIPSPDLHTLYPLLLVQLMNRVERDFNYGRHRLAKPRRQKTTDDQR